MPPSDVDSLTLEQKLEHFWMPLRKPPPAHASLPVQPTRAPPVTDEQVAQFEGERGVTLPASFVRLLRKQDGGRPRWKHHPGVNGEVAEIRGLGPKRPMKTSWEDELGYMEEEDISEPSGLASMVAFSGDGHYFVCLDYGRGSPAEPAVTFVDVELFEPAVVLGRTFDEFVEGLRYDSFEHAWALPADAVGADPGGRLGAALELPLEPHVLGQYECPDDDPGLEGRFPDEPGGSGPGSRGRVCRNEQRDATRKFPWRDASEWILSLSGPAELARRIEAGLTGAGIPWVLVCEPRE